MYDLSDLDSVEEIKNRLIQTINSIDFSQSNTAPATSNASANMANAQILQEIFKMQDSIAKLTASIESKDSATVSLLADKLAATNTKTSDAVMLETLLPRLLDNPEQLLRLMQIAEQFPAKK